MLQSDGKFSFGPIDEMVKQEETIKEPEVIVENVIQISDDDDEDDPRNLICNLCKYINDVSKIKVMPGRG